MSNTTPSPRSIERSPENNTDDRGATVVITHKVHPGMSDAYEEWLKRIGPVCRGFPGHIDWQVIRPIAGLSGTYTAVIRFDTEDHLRHWMFSDDRQRFIAEARPLLEDDDRFHITSGLDIWFAPEGSHVSAPLRWKQFLVTWSVIYPLVLLVPLLTVPLFALLGLPKNLYLMALVDTGAVVYLTAFVVMPPYTLLLKRWLFG